MTRGRTADGPDASTHELIAEIVQLAGWDIEVGDSARRTMCHAQLVVVAERLAIELDMLGPPHKVAELLDRLSVQQLRALIGWLADLEYGAFELVDGDLEFQREGDERFRRAELVKLRDVLQEVTRR